MLKIWALAISLSANCLTAYVLFQPTSEVRSKDRMTCAQARNENDNKAAVRNYADREKVTISEVHEYLRNSDYELRNIDVADGRLTFTYRSSGFYPHTCGIHLPGIDGGILHVETDMAIDHTILSVR